MGCRPIGSSREPSIPEWTSHEGQPYRVRVSGEDFKWHILYPGPDEELGTDDDIRSQRDLHLPAGTDIVIELASKDYVYMLSFPELDLKEIAVPDLKFTLQFNAKQTGTFQLLGDQMCGYTHPDLLGKLFVHSRDEYGKSLAKIRRSSTSSSSAGR